MLQKKSAENGQVSGTGLQDQRQHGFTRDPSVTERPYYLGKSNFYRRGFYVAVTLAVLNLVLFISSLVILIKVLDSRHCPDPCADGWIWYKKQCYFFSDETEHWDKAQEFCTSQNSSLAHIKSKQELDFVIRYKGPSDHWIGLRREQEKPWKWTDGTQFNDTFEISQDSDCVCLNHDAGKSAGCTTSRKWICSKIVGSPF
uniref:C-type lectin domain family 2 member D-like isoform X2 n=1 Tax=Geotrypetes seraphini TaxID=260995 RepID=A0A6P8P7W8_GEOSA|nr:C-type lectin domain family 2 member D-like isoform X2 [Geotrypetes seraphini]